jgi:hypothetical protein
MERGSLSWFNEILSAEKGFGAAARGGLSKQRAASVSGC